MKQIAFTLEQRNLLQELLRIRLEDYNESTGNNSSDKIRQKRFNNFYIKPLISALDKIESNYNTIYDKKEKLTIISCINEHYDNFYNEMGLPTALSWLTISEEQRNFVSKLDNCKDILLKCGYYKKINLYKKYDIEFQYRKIVSAVDKLKKANQVFLSKVGQNDYYKIAFVYDNKEYIPFELKHKVSWKDFQFISLRCESPEKVGMKNFSIVTTKQKAKKLLSSCKKEYYPEGV